MNNLKILRKEHGLTQTEIAKELNLQQATYSAYEVGVNEPSIATLKKLSKLYNVSIDYLVDNDIKGVTVYTEEQNQVINLLVKLNELNLVKAYSYIAGLVAGQS